VIDLKKRVRELKKELIDKNQQLEQRKKDPLLLRTQEIETELQMYKLETQRLRSMLSHVLSLNEQTYLAADILGTRDRWSHTRLKPRIFN
jgi:cell shape-determining protein MreC